MKSIFLILMFTTSTFIGRYYSYMLREREMTLKELNNFFKHLLIKISSKSNSLIDCVRDWDSAKHIKKFLSLLEEKLECGCACPFASASKELYVLNSEDLSYIKSLSIGELDWAGQIKALENAICYFEGEIKDAEHTENKRHIASYAGVLTGLALVIIFI